MFYLYLPQNCTTSVYMSNLQLHITSRLVVIFRSVLTHLKVDAVALQNSERSGRVKGVIVTIKGTE